MHGTNSLTLCPAEMYRLLALALNEDWYIVGADNPRVEVTNVVYDSASGCFSVTVKAASPKPQSLVNRPPPPHDNAPEHEARHA